MIEPLHPAEAAAATLATWCSSSNHFVGKEQVQAWLAQDDNRRIAATVAACLPYETRQGNRALPGDIQQEADATRTSGRGNAPPAGAPVEWDGAASVAPVRSCLRAPGTHLRTAKSLTWEDLQKRGLHLALGEYYTLLGSPHEGSSSRPTRRTAAPSKRQQGSLLGCTTNDLLALLCPSPTRILAATASCCAALARVLWLLMALVLAWNLSQQELRIALGKRIVPQAPPVVLAPGPAPWGALLSNFKLQPQEAAALAGAELVLQPFTDRVTGTALLAAWLMLSWLWPLQRTAWAALQSRRRRGLARAVAAPRVPSAREVEQLCCDVRHLHEKICGIKAAQRRASSVHDALVELKGMYEEVGLRFEEMGNDEAYAEVQDRLQQLQAFVG